MSLTLKPRVPISSPNISSLLLAANHDSDDDSDDETSQTTYYPETTFYMCLNRCTFSVIFDNQTLCAKCKRSMCALVSFVGSPCRGFVKEVVTYMVMDDFRDGSRN